MIRDLKNMYKVILIEDFDKFNSWCVQADINKCRKSLDGSKVIVKVPESFHKNKSEYQNNKPFLDHSEALKLMHSSEWTSPEDETSTGSLKSNLIKQS